MRRAGFTLWALTFLLTYASDTMEAQTPNDLYCAVTLEGQNRNRTVAGAVNVECGFDTEPHTAPFGNWGVNSFYGRKKDTDQFRGWKHEDGPSTKRHWNSCTTRDPTFAAPNCDFYNANECTTQSRSEVVTHGTVTYRSANQCPQHLSPDNPRPSGCANKTGTTAAVTNNNMEIFELDSVDPTGGRIVNDDDPVENLYFPSTRVTFTECTYAGCAEKNSAWERMTGSSSASADVRAEMRTKAKAHVVGVCDMEWDWD